MKLLENSRARGFTQAFQYHCTEREREREKKNVYFTADNFLEAIVLANSFHTQKKRLFQKKRCGAEKGPFVCVCEVSTSEARKHATVCV